MKLRIAFQPLKRATADPWFPDAVATFGASGAKTAPVTGAPSTNKQSFLEATPYSNQANVPVNTFKAKVGFKVVINNSLPLRLYLKEGVDRGSARGA